MTWDLTRVQQWVLPKDKDKNSKECIGRRVELLTKFLNDPEENIFDILVESGDNDDDENERGDGVDDDDDDKNKKRKKLAETFLIRVQDQAMYLFRAYKNALAKLYNGEKDPKGNLWTWQSVCQYTVNQINKVTGFN